MSGRYEVVELDPDERGRRQWGIHDTTAGQIVEDEDEGEPIAFGLPDSAEDWIVRQNYLNGVQFVPR